MTIRIQSVVRSAVVASGVAALLAGATSRAAAQATTLDPRWQAWVGCWKPAPTEGASRELGNPGAVCVMPAQGGVEIVTVLTGKVMDRATIIADGAARSISKDGCTGTETARWSKTGNRVYLSSALSCPGNLERKSNGIMSLTQSGEWLDVQGVSGKDAATGVFVARYAVMEDVAGLPADVAAAVPARGLSANLARTAAMAQLTLGDIADASAGSDAGVVQAWLVERTRGLELKLDATRLTELADQGVSPQVIDVLVALAYPKVFAVNPGTRDADFRPMDTSAQRNARALARLYGLPYGWSYLSPYDLDGCAFDRYGYSYGYNYGFSRYGCYSPYGYRNYGSGYYPTYGGYYGGGGTIIVVNRGSEGSNPSQPHGRVVKGKGYTSGDRASSGSSGGPPSSSSGSSGSSSASSGSSSGSGSSASPPRTAHKKP